MQLKELGGREVSTRMTLHIPLTILGVEHSQLPVLVISCPVSTRTISLTLDKNIHR